VGLGLELVGMLAVRVGGGIGDGVCFGVREGSGLGVAVAVDAAVAAVAVTDGVASPSIWSSSSTKTRRLAKRP